jgi:hypothetical protein
VFITADVIEFEPPTGTLIDEPGIAVPKADGVALATLQVNGNCPVLTIVAVMDIP